MPFPKGAVQRAIAADGRPATAISQLYDYIVGGMWQGLVQHIKSILGAAESALPFAPHWAVSLVVLVAVTLAAWLLHAAIVAVLDRLFRGRRPYLRSVLDQTKNPTRLALLLIALAIALPTAPLGPETKIAVVRCLALGTICLLGWIALTALHIGANLYLMRFRIDVEDNLSARKHLTQMRVLVRVLDTIIILVTLGFALMTFDEVRQYGVSLFASAGVAGVVFGLAAQPVLSNLIAGVQLAVTQPIRLEDAVTVQNEYGWIEEINATYVVIRLEDQRRLIVPLNYFIQQPFYNWTRQATPTLATIKLFLDYAAPVDLIRKKAIALVAEMNKDNAKVISVQLTNASTDTIEVHIQVNSDSAATTGSVSVDLREKLIGFLQREHPEALPRRRTEIIERAEGKTGAAAPSPPSG
jgi:small-conductance mechanosensitive channel